MGFLGFLKWLNYLDYSHENDKIPTKIPPIFDVFPLYIYSDYFPPLVLKKKEEEEVYIKGNNIYLHETMRRTIKMFLRPPLH